MQAAQLAPAAASRPAGVSEQIQLPQAGARYLALDAYRGFIMLVLASSGFGFAALKNDSSWGWLAAQFDHVAWEGAVFWDLIQPAFMFMVGVAMPFALARRIARGASFGDNIRHVAARSLRLVLLSQILICVSAGKLSFQLINVLSQIAFTYFICFLLMEWSARRQVLSAALLLAGHWALFLLFPGPEGPFSKTGNIGQVIDRVLLGYNYSGYYVTINFISSTVTTLFGVWTGRLLMSPRSHRDKVQILTAAMAGAFAAGLLLARWNPLVKRLWTASFTFYSTGWVLLMLLVFYWAIEMRGYRRAAFPLVVVGMNSIFIYSIGQVLKGWLNRAVAVFTGNYSLLGAWGVVAQASTVVLVMWYLCYWLYRKQIFLKL